MPRPIDRPAGGLLPTQLTAEACFLLEPIEEQLHLLKYIGSSLPTAAAAAATVVCLFVTICYCVVSRYVG